MGVVVLPCFLLLSCLAFLTREEGIPLPSPLLGIPLPSRLDLFGYLVRNTPEPTSQVLRDNLLVWLISCSLAYLVLYLPPLRTPLHHLKLNPKYPGSPILGKEIVRSIGAVVIGTGMQVLCSQLFICEAPSSPSLPGYLATVLLLYLWSDTHFYFTHRALHLPWAYKWVHKTHHESVNTDPFSGLSMHPLESAIYFSTSSLLTPFTSPWVPRLLTLCLIVFPLEGHWGYGSWAVEGSYNHYIHHTKFNWNFGSSPLWDHMLGTNYPRDRKSVV